MVRIVWITALMAILCIVLYLPSAFPPERFIEVLRSEHAMNREVWGPVVADRILRRMLDMQQATPPLSDPPAPTVQPVQQRDRKSTRLNSSHVVTSRMPSSA